MPIPEAFPVTTLNSYRPISLLSVLSKLLEHRIYAAITDHLQFFQLMSVSQRGFLPGKSDVTVSLVTLFGYLRVLERLEVLLRSFEKPLAQSSYRTNREIKTDMIM